MNQLAAILRTLPKLGAGSRSFNELVSLFKSEEAGIPCLMATQRGSQADSLVGAFPGEMSPEMY